MQTANKRKSTRQAAQRQTQRATSKPSCLQAVLQYVKDGWSVIPLEPRGKRPRVDWTQYQTIPATREQVSEWWRQWPDANVGIVTGTISDLLVLDIDGEEGEATLTELEKKHGPLPPTITVTTGRGRHLYFACPSASIGSTVRAFGIGVDVRCEGGYVVAPPSVHANGVRYRWNSDAPQSLPRAPQWLVTALTAPLPSVGVVGPSAEGKIYEGQRNSTLTSIAGALRRQGCNEESILTTIQSENSARCVPPLSSQELQTIAHSVAGYPPSADTEPHTDIGNARRLLVAHGQDLRFCNAWKKWLVWDGSRWALDVKGDVTRLTKETIRHLAITAATGNDGDSKLLLQHAVRSQSEGRVMAMINLAKSEQGIPVVPDELDADQWVLNVLNGTIDLKTGVLKAHRREDLITKLAPVQFQPDADCPTWEEFLARIMGGNPTLIRFLQQALGYSLTGSSREQCLLLLYGTGANGKSTLLSTVSTLLGDYAKQTSGDTLLVKQRDGIPNDIARLQGARFVSSVEVEQGKPMAEALVKRVTGGDRLTARFLYGEHFEFDPTFKIWVGVNHKPTIKGTDHAIWRRIRLVPFTVTIPPKERDKDLVEKLRTELSGILNWAIQGCLDWQRDGLVVPKEVKVATQGYQDEMDTLKSFIGDCCELNPYAETSGSDLYGRYVEWCRDNGEYAMKQRNFSKWLEERGYVRTRNSHARCWKGISLKP